MELPVNTFKRALREGRHQTGLWMSLASHYATEAVAGAGFDWLLLDMEHSPNDYDDILRQLQVVKGCASHAGGPPALERHGDLQAPARRGRADPDRALRPERGRGAQRRGLHPLPAAGRARLWPVRRASRWGLYPDYVKEANERVCLLVQVETATALENLDAIAATEGVDGVFIGPSDLSASMGHVGNAAHPEVQAAIEDAIARILKAGKAPGILTPDEQLAQHYLSLGAVFVAVGLDTQILMRQTAALASRFKAQVSAMAPAKGSTY